MKDRSDVPGWGVSENKILDDPARYDFDDGSKDSWGRVLVRLPGITDFHGIIDQNGDETVLEYKSGQNVEFMVRQAEEGERGGLAGPGSIRVENPGWPLPAGPRGHSIWID